MRPLSADDPRMIGDFRLQARLGAGGMGRVFLASSPGGRAVAVKVIHTQLARDAAFKARFRREVAAALAVNGGYAAPVIAAGPDDDPPWLATAYVPGPSLQEVVTAAGPLPADAVLKLAAGLAEALRAIHACGLVHRDLKPGNVLLATDGPRVIDFGIARALNGTVLTSAESLLGTPSYMSPEQAQSQPTGPASDVFSLGGVVYFAATGANPFGSGHPAVMLYRIVHTEPDLEPLPAELRGLVAACLAKDPAARPTPAQLTAGLGGIMPPGDSPAAFWPESVARLISGHQNEPPPGGPVLGGPVVGGPVVGGPVLGGPVAGSPVAGAPVLGAPVLGAPVLGAPVLDAEPVTPSMAGPQDPTPLVRPGGPLGGPGSTGPVLPALQAPAGAGPAGAGPAMGRRRALAALAGAVTGGLAVAGYELTRSRGAGRARPLAATSPVRPRAAAGHQVWSYPIGASVRSVAVAAGTVFAGTADNTIYALHAVTGKLLWKRATTNASNDYLGVSGQTLVVGDGLDGGVFGLNAVTGQQHWSVSSPLGVLGLVVAGGRAYAGTAVKSNTDGGVSTLNADSGELLWTAQWDDTDGGLAVAGGTVYVTAQGGHIYAYRGTDGTRLWHDTGKNVQFGAAPPVIAGGRLYVSSQGKTPGMYAVATATGRSEWRVPLGANPNGLPAYSAATGGRLFAGTTRLTFSTAADAGDLTALDAATGKQLWKVQIPGGVGLSPAAAGGVVYTGSNNGVLTAWQATTGQKVWSFGAAAGIGTDIIVTGGVAYFGSSDHRLYAVAV
jgi:outer membrane protein assembly factor BamB